MRKTIFITGLISFFTFSLISCGKDDDGGDTAASGTVGTTLSESEIQDDPLLSELYNECKSDAELNFSEEDCLCMVSKIDEEGIASADEFDDMEEEDLAALFISCVDPRVFLDFDDESDDDVSVVDEY